MRRTNGVSAVGKGSFQRLTVSSVWIEFHVALRERVELTVITSLISGRRTPRGQESKRHSALSVTTSLL